MHTLLIRGSMLAALIPLLKGARTREHAGSSDVTLSEASLPYQARKLNRNRDALPISCLQATSYFSEHP